MKESPSKDQMQEEEFEGRDLRALIDTLPDQFYIKDTEGRYLFNNTEHGKVLGLASPKEAAGKTVFDFYPKELAERYHADEQEIFRSGQPLVGKEEPSVDPGGNRRWHSTTKVPLRDGSKKIVGLVGMTRDITEHKEAEEALFKSRVRFQAVFENAAIGIGLVDTEGWFTESNPALQQMLGYNSEELVSMRWIEVTHPDDIEPDMSHFEKLAAGELDSYQLEKRYVRKDGRVRWGHLTCSLIRSAEGEPQFLIGMVEDVTERKLAEEKLRESEKRFRNLIQNASDIIAILDADGIMRYKSPAVERILGYREEELVGTKVFDYIHPNDLENVKRTFAAALESPGVHPPVQFRFRHANGYWRYIEAIRNNLMKDPNVRGIVVNTRDITERKEAEEALRKSEASLAEAQSLAHLGNWEWDIQTSEMLWSDEVFRIYGYEPKEDVPSLDQLVELAHPDDRELIKKNVYDAVYECKPLEFEYRIVRPDGEERALHCQAKVYLDEEGEPSRMIGTVHDITERKALEEYLEHQAFHDSLTELPNRALFLDRLEHALARTRRESGPVTVLLLDLNNFKVINDSLGHDAGNSVLVEVARRLRDSVRSGDTVGRLFGDEFAVLLEAPSHVDETKRIAKRIQERVEEPFEIEGREVFITLSIGIAFSETVEDQPKEILRHADLAMYEAKRSGKAQHALYIPSMNTRAMERLNLENVLRRAIEREEFEVLYQPIIDLHTSDIAGVEALARLRHPERGLVAASEFVQLAEEIGLIRPISQWLTKEACRQAKEWHERYPERALLMSVNFSTSQFSHQPDLIPKILSDTGLNPQGLQLEITERTVMDDAEFSLERLQRLKALGVSLAIDDYGMGYSGLYYLKRMPVDYLKIDRSFIMGLGEDPGDEAIVSGTIGIAHALGLKVTAEGVETAAQFTKLKELGCDLAQGFHLAEPLSGEAMSALLASDRRW